MKMATMGLMTAGAGTSATTEASENEAEEAIERCFVEVERRARWAQRRRKLVAKVCRQVCDEDRGPIRMDHSAWANDPFLHWSDLRPEHDPQEVIEGFAEVRAFEGDGGDDVGAGGAIGAGETAEQDELLVGLSVAYFVDSVAIEHLLAEYGLSRWANVGTFVELLAPSSTVERLGFLARFRPDAPLMAEHVLRRDERVLAGSVREVEAFGVEPGKAAREWVARLATRPMRRLVAPELDVVAPWTKAVDAGWDDGELVASLLRELALMAAVRGLLMEKEDDGRRVVQDGWDDSESDVRERLDVFERRLAAARVERGQRMERALKPLGFQVLVRESDLTEMEAEVLLVVAGLELLGEDTDVALEVGDGCSKGQWLGREVPLSVGGVSSLLGGSRKERLAVRELLRPEGRLVRSGLVELSAFGEGRCPWIDPSTSVALSSRAAAVISGVKALAGFGEAFADERELLEDAACRAPF
jgi:hypothetical protein